jgi:homoserine dehydrogenase
MTDEGKKFQEVLEVAKKLGYAEIDPSLDIEGIDTTHKLSILLSLLYGKKISPDNIYTEGITRIQPIDIEFAMQLGYRIKLLAIFKDENGEIEARVHPTLIPADSLLSHVKGVYNGVYIYGDAVGSTLFYGQGAGMMPTGSAVVSDLMEISRNILKGNCGAIVPLIAENKNVVKVKARNQFLSKYYLRFSALDSPGVLSHISGILGKYNISIASVIQRGRQQNEMVPIFMLIHQAQEESVAKALKEIDVLPETLDKTMLIRIEDRLID